MICTRNIFHCSYSDHRVIANRSSNLNSLNFRASSSPNLIIHVLLLSDDVSLHCWFSWFSTGFYKQLPEPISTEACRRLQYRRKSDSVKRTVREKFLGIWWVRTLNWMNEVIRSTFEITHSLSIQYTARKMKRKTAYFDTWFRIQIIKFVLKIGDTED